MGNYHLMSKPVGSVCNLNCTYCYYVEKENMFGFKDNKFSKEILETYVYKYINSHDGPIVEFAWQGGEPTIAGIDFYKEAIKLQNKFKGRKQITNTIQTNGILLDDKWCRFFKEHNFLVGLSLDGSEKVHNTYRKDVNEDNSHKNVVRSLNLLHQYGIEFNILTTINDMNAKQPLELYNYYKTMGIQYIQFTPVVEREVGELSKAMKLKLSTPEEIGNQVTPWSVGAVEYGDFLIAIFDEWVTKDIGSIFIMNFEWALSAAVYGISGVCHFSRTCGTSGVLEVNGDIYSCDHYVYPSNKIGNILVDDLNDVFEGKKQSSFGNAKYNSLSHQCKSCAVLPLCFGGCPKHRFDNGQNYLCKSYERFFKHILPYAEVVRELIRKGKPLSDLMDINVVCK